MSCGRWCVSGLVLLSLVGCKHDSSVSEPGMPSDDDLGAHDGATSGDGSTPTGPTLSVLAGQLGGRGNGDGTGATARFFGPSHMVGDGAGTVYVADTFNRVVRKVVVATGVVTTLAITDGTSPIALTEPSGVALDGAGHLFVVDKIVPEIFEVTLATQVATVLAGSTKSASVDGTGTAAQFASPAAITFDAGNLYVADGSTIRRIVIATGVTTTLAGSSMLGTTDGIGTAARFEQPSAITTDHAGNLYVTDAQSARIRKLVLASGTVTTIAGSTPGSADGTGIAAQFSQPADVVFDGAGHLYIADSNNTLVRTLDLATAAVTTVAGLLGSTDDVDGTGTAAHFGDVLGLALEGDSLYVGDGEGTLRKLVVATSAVTTLAGKQAPPLSLDGTGAAAAFRGGIQGIANDGAGNLYVTSDGEIRKVVLPTGAVTTLAGASGTPTSLDGVGTASRLGTPAGIAYDGAGTLYFVDSFFPVIRKLTIATAQVTTIAGTWSGTAGMMGLFGTTDGVGAAARFERLSSVTCDGTAALYVTDGNSVRRIDTASATVSTFAGSIDHGGSVDGVGSAASFSTPLGIVNDGNGNLYVADTDNHTIRKIVIATAQVTTLAGSIGVGGSRDGALGVALFREPWGLSLTTNGLFVADLGNATIRRIDLSAGTVSTVAGIAGQSGVVPGPLPARISGSLAVTSVPGGFVTTGEGALLLAQGI